MAQGIADHAAVDDPGTSRSVRLRSVDGRPAEFVRLRLELRTIIDESVDRVLFCNLGARQNAARRAMTYLGRPPTLTGDASALIL